MTREYYVHKLPLVLKDRDEKMAKRAADAVYSTFEAIADDLFVDDYGRHDESIILDFEAVVEMSLDAGRPEMYGGDEEAIKWLNVLSYEEMKIICTMSFMEEEYVW